MNRQTTGFIFDYLYVRQRLRMCSKKVRVQSRDISMIGQIIYNVSK